MLCNLTSSQHTQSLSAICPFSICCVLSHVLYYDYYFLLCILYVSFLICIRQKNKIYESINLSESVMQYVAGLLKIVFIKIQKCIFLMIWILYQFINSLLNILKIWIHACVYITDAPIPAHTYFFLPLERLIEIMVWLSCKLQDQGYR